MPLTRSQARRNKRRKIRDPSIECLPDAVLGCVGGFLVKTSRALLGVALSSDGACCNSNNDDWDALDFADLDKDLAARLSDDDLASVLQRIDAPATLKTLKLTGLVGITGKGLRCLKRSTALRQIDLSLVGMHQSPLLEPVPMISEDAVLPVLEIAISTTGSSLRHIQLPKKWRVEKSHTLRQFLDKYSCQMRNRFDGCSNCAETMFPIGVQWIPSGSNDRVLQEFTCYQCTEHFCYPCEAELYRPDTCDRCEKKFCDDCVSTSFCEGCQKRGCSECAPMELCEGCDCYLCCEPVSTCSICEETRCMECSPHNHCEGEGCDESNCMSCASEETVEFCDSCWKEYCPGCRLTEYRKNRDEFCVGCKALLCNVLDRENESLRRNIDEALRQLEGNQGQEPVV